MRLDVRDGGPDGGEAPRVVGLEDAVGGGCQAGGDAHGVGRARLKGGGDEAVERGVQPLAPALQGRIEPQDRRSRAFLQDGEGRNRPVELHEDLGVRRNLGVAVAGDHRCDAQAALGGEGVHVVGSEPRGGGIDDDAVLPAALPAGVVGLEEEGARVEPGEGALGGRVDGDEGGGGLGGGEGEGNRQGGDAGNLVAARRYGDGLQEVGQVYGGVAVAVGPAAAEVLIDGQPHRLREVAVAARWNGAHVDDRGIGDVLPDPQARTGEGDVVVAVGAAGGALVVDVEADGAERVPAGSRGAGAHVQLEGVPDVLPDANIDGDGAGAVIAVGGGGGGGGGERKHAGERGEGRELQPGSACHVRASSPGSAQPYHRRRRRPGRKATGTKVRCQLLCVANGNRSRSGRRLDPGRGCGRGWWA